MEIIHKQPEREKLQERKRKTIQISKEKANYHKKKDKKINATRKTNTEEEIRRER